MQKIIIKIVSLFVLCSLLLSNTYLYGEDSLAIWSKVSHPTKEFQVEKIVRTILSRDNVSVNLDLYDCKIPYRVDRNTTFIMDLRDKPKGGERYRKRKSGGDWVVYCALFENGVKSEFQVTIKPDKECSAQPLEPVNRTYEIKYDGKYVVRPLDGINPEEVRKILVYTEDYLDKLGELTIFLWPLVSALHEKYPKAVIYVESPKDIKDDKSRYIRDIFSSEAYRDIIKQVEFTLEKGPEFIATNNIDMVFDISNNMILSEEVAKKLSGRVKDLPYLFVISPPTQAKDSAIFIDRKGHRSEVYGAADISEKTRKTVPAVPEWRPVVIKDYDTPNVWLYAIEAYRLLGLDLSPSKLPVKMISAEEAVRGFAILKKWYDEANRDEPFSKFDPKRKIIVINVFAITQRRLLSKDDWVVVIVELMKNIKNAYFLFTHGGPTDTGILMDHDSKDMGIDYVESIVRMVNYEMKRQGMNIGGSDTSQIILPKLDSLYPVIHEIFGITTAFVSVDTGLSHLGPGVYDIPTAIITSESILHWLPPREKAAAIIVPNLTDRQLASQIEFLPEELGNEILRRFPEDRINFLRNGIKEFALKIDKNPEVGAARDARLAAASIEDRAAQDRQLLANIQDQDCNIAREDVTAYLEKRIEILGLSGVISLPKIVFVDSAPQTGFRSPRFVTKLATSSKGLGYLMIDRSVLERDKDGVLMVPDRIKGLDIMHEVVGHLLARTLFSDFMIAHAPTTVMKKPDLDRDPDTSVSLPKWMEEEMVAKFTTILATHILYAKDRSLVGVDLKGSMKELGLNIRETHPHLWLEASIKWMKIDKNMSAWRYIWPLNDKSEKTLINSMRKDYLLKIFETFGVEYKENDMSDPSQNLPDPYGIAKDIVGGIISSRLNNHEVVLAFDRNIAGGQSAMAIGVIEEIERLKKISDKYGKLLDHVTILKIDPALMPSVLEKYLKDDRTAVFIFARESERTAIKDMEGKAHTIYVDEADINSLTYYPLSEIVAIALTYFTGDPETIESMRPMIEERLKIKVDTMGARGLKFIFLEKPIAFDTHEELMKRHARIKEMLWNA